MCKGIIYSRYYETIASKMQKSQTITGWQCFCFSDLLLWDGRKKDQINDPCRQSVAVRVKESASQAPGREASTYFLGESSH